MIAALDATPLTISSGGVRRYTEQLANALQHYFPEDTYHLISDQLPPAKGLDRRWWTIGVQRAMRRLGCEVFHGTEFAVPYFPLRPSVLTLHDLSPWMNPEWHHNAGRVRRRTPYLLKFGIATMVITGTEAIRQQALEYFRLPPGRVIVVPLAAAENFRPVQIERPEFLYERPYFLYVGTIEPRKGVPALVNAWRELRARRDVDLILAGRWREDAPRIAPEAGLHILGEVAEPDLPALYSAAVGCVYPTLYEGFGLPVLEAMQCGCPVITSRDGAVQEVSGGAAIHVVPDGLVSAMESLLTDDVERQRRSELSLRRAAQFSWEQTARQTREVYREAIRRFHG